MINSFLNKVLISLILIGTLAPVAAHTYFFGLTDITLNSQSKQIEVIHQFTAHDIENAIAEIKQENFSPEHPKYNQYIRSYFENNFELKHDNKIVLLDWLGFEIKQGHLFIYQESTHKNNLINLVVKNTLLVDTYPSQINTVNYQNLLPENKVQGSLIFDQSLRVADIATHEK